ncbi:hypothetical protein ACFQPI_20510, partial [Insolitispirillum peregrinum]|uniref:hypothetical protein n=1 Tax=Insolitispirillum peregrinum TaxID=80876 RepID=UPI00361F629B
NGGYRGKDGTRDLAPMAIMAKSPPIHRPLHQSVHSSIHLPMREIIESKIIITVKAFVNRT